ncbi:MAG: pyroglutamyl-peptidase I [Proteobacteria bacterium]|nr:pyroglutamyl-peptidase I [Pseudomonadota bacterium]
MRALIAGFEPFGGEDENASIEAVRRLPARVGDWDIETLELPVSYARAMPLLQTVLDLHRPALVLAVGQAGGREALCLERVAINVQDARIPDNDGAQPIDRPAVEGGPAAHFTGLPVKACVAALRDAGLKAAVSNTAGTFVCNHLFYALMHAAGPRGIRAGFLHVPVLPTQQEALAGAPSMAVEDIARGIVVVLETCAARSADIATAEGALD